MFQVIESGANKLVTLDRFDSDPRFSHALNDLRNQAALVAPRLRGTVWMVNSTERGGGVAEMLPTLVSLLRELGIPAQWGVIGTQQRAFFDLTKRLHNLLHGQGDPSRLGPASAQLLTAVGRANAKLLRTRLRPNDVLFVHDPQPIALGSILARETGACAVWRCHIGTEERNAATRAAWRFLEPFLREYDHALFSAPEYVPSYLSEHASIVYPGLNPLTHKNRDLSVSKLVGILRNSGLLSSEEPVPTEDFDAPVLRVAPDGTLARAGELGLLHRPIILQVSRWDRLKGFVSLLEGFARMKLRAARTRRSALEPRNLRRLQLSRLLLAGPDPRGVADDPEGREVFDELCARYRALPSWLHPDVALLSLPMSSTKENALIVNSLQRCASLVVQNSLREGFGLTVAEAMWKHQAILGTHAVGIRHQIRDGIDGELTDDPTDADEIARRLRRLLVSPGRRYELGRGAHRRVRDRFLVLQQLAGYLEAIGRALERHGARRALAGR